MGEFRRWPRPDVDVGVRVWLVGFLAGYRRPAVGASLRRSLWLLTETVVVWADPARGDGSHVDDAACCLSRRLLVAFGDARRRSVTYGDVR